MSYFSVDRVKEIINDYHVNLENVREHRVEYDSIGVQSLCSLPKGNAVSDVTCNEAMSKVSENQFMDSIISDMKYIDDRVHRVKVEQDAEILDFKLQGCSTLDIAQMIGMSRQTVDRRFNVIAREINGLSKT